jgi:hypothetical protein
MFRFCSSSKPYPAKDLENVLERFKVYHRYTRAAGNRPTGRNRLFRTFKPPKFLTTIMIPLHKFSAFLRLPASAPATRHPDQNVSIQADRVAANVPVGPLTCPRPWFAFRLVRSLPRVFIHFSLAAHCAIGICVSWNEAH